MTVVAGEEAGTQVRDGGEDARAGLPPQRPRPGVVRAVATQARWFIGPLDADMPARLGRSVHTQHRLQPSPNVAGRYLMTAPM